MAVNMIMAVLEPIVTVVDLKLSFVDVRSLGDRDFIVNIRHQTSDIRHQTSDIRRTSDSEPRVHFWSLDYLDQTGQRIARKRWLERQNF